MNLFRDDPCFYWPEDLDIVWLGLWFLEGRIRFLKIGPGFLKVGFGFMRIGYVFFCGSDPGFLRVEFGFLRIGYRFLEYRIRGSWGRILVS